jgi:hypothetical protein
VLWIWITLLALAGAIVWIARRSRRDGRTGREQRDEWEEKELRDAEEEVRGLDAFATPEDADDQLPDWGPGAGPGSRR